MGCMRLTVSAAVTADRCWLKLHMRAFAREGNQIAKS